MRTSQSSVRLPMSRPSGRGTAEAWRAEDLKAFELEQELAVARRQFLGIAAGDVEKCYRSFKTPAPYECSAWSVNLYNESKANRCRIGV